MPHHTSPNLRLSVSEFGWEVIDEFGPDLQIELNEDGQYVWLRICDYMERSFLDTEKEMFDDMVRVWLDMRDDLDGEVIDDGFEFEFQMRVRERD